MAVVVPVVIQKPIAAAQTACGPQGARFKVDLDEGNHALRQPEPGKALVYFVQDMGGRISMTADTTRIGIDGTWVGANKGDSWFSVSVEPGVHHICANAHSHFLGNVIELAHFTAEAGHIYYYRTRSFMWQTRRLEFAPVDSDQGLYMIGSSPASILRPLK